MPAGHALTVDRDLFAAEVTRALEEDPAIEIRREEVTALDPEHIWIIASGPLTSDALAAEIGRLTGSQRLFFYDSISPIVDAESIDTSIAFAASRYGKSLDGTDDYLNCPSTKPSTKRFWMLCWRPRTSRRTSAKITLTTSKPACRLKRSRGEAATRCASGR